MSESDERGGAGMVSDTLHIGHGAKIDALYPHVYYAALDSLARFSAAELVDAVLRSDNGSMPGTRIGPVDPTARPHAAAHFVVSVDSPDRFDPELSMREPLELQVWSDGTFAVEIEFVGEDIRTYSRAGEPLRDVLAEWAEARGWRLADVYNDRGRSLPDVWNAAFITLDTGASVAEAVEFARRAILVAESHRYGGKSVERLLALLRSGDVEGLLGTPVTAVLQPRPGYTPDEDCSIDVAQDVCAFANAVHGGLVVLGLEERDGRVAAVSPTPLKDCAQRLDQTVRRTVFPVPEQLLVEEVRMDGDLGLVFVHVPPQDRVLKPFLVHGAVVDGRLHRQGVSLVERRGETIYFQGIAALHAQIAAGRALLRGEKVADRRRH
jgi:hypothetical protein